MGKQQGVELAVEVTDDLFAELRRLAGQRFGNSGGRAVGRIVGEALDQWAELRASGEEEPKGKQEPVAMWNQTSEIPRDETGDLVRAWLFREGT